MKTVFVDIDTQLDFLYPAGALYVPGAERIVPAIARLNRFAAEQKTPVISTVDAHTEDDPEFQVWPHHCVAGAWGQRKAESTLLPRRVVVPNRECDLADLAGAQQIVVEKQTVDAFRSANLGRVLEALRGERYVVYGVVTEICVYYAVRGLLETGCPVIAVSDAVESLKAADGQKAIAEMCAGGAMVAPADEVCGG
jgi:nicotinamidase/pyrazinamidase